MPVRLPLTKGFSKSAFRKIEKQWKCRCGNASDKRWHLTLSDPAGMQTAHVPLCGSCGPVLFDRLASEGWLTSPVIAESVARGAAELAQKEIVPPKWRHGPWCRPGECGPSCGAEKPMEEP